MKCTMQWGKGCQNEADHEVRQNDRDRNGKILDTTYHLGFNCAKHVPDQNYVITEIK